MSYIITAYKVLEKGKVEICLDDKFSFQLYKGEARKLSLKEEMELSEEQYAYILYEILAKRAIRRAMHLLERQERTEYQLREKLLQNAYPQEAVEEAVSYVKRYHYLDDVRYAHTYVRYHQEKKSRMRLKTDLMRKGIAKDVIDNALDDEYVNDEREQIRNLLEKKKFTPETADTAEFRKIYQFLQRRGFKSSDILSVMKNKDMLYDLGC
ncbi:MAG: regulatory protein RecX [Lachnospiraceae bacterium]|nr:regulatory protein RecX [Lachnospiraceae bacterium]